MNEKHHHNFVLFIVSISVVEVVVNNHCPNVLTEGKERIQVEFKFYEEYNKLVEETETKWSSVSTFSGSCMKYLYLKYF